MENGNEMENEYADVEANVTSTAKMSPSTAYITLANNDLLKRKTNDIIRSIAMENPEEVHPLYAFRNREFIRLIFPSNQARNNAVERKLSIFGIRVTLELPRQPMKKTTIHLYNLPIEEKNSDVEKWLKGLGFTVMTEMRWTCYQNTKIRNGGRSYVISAPEDKEIPGYAQFRSAVQGKTIWGQIWYHLMPEWCRRCKEKHGRKDCGWNADGNHGMDPNSYAAKAYGGFRSHLGSMGAQGMNEAAVSATGNQEATMANTARDKGTSLDLAQPEMTTLSTSQVIIRSNVAKQASESSSTNELNQPGIVPFYSTSGSTSFLSNHHECKINVNGISYDSTEHYLFSEKARHTDNDKTMKKIQVAQTPAKARQLGRSINWDEDRYGTWEAFASQKLRESNICKYQQHIELRRKLFETAPKRLVEANPHNLRWGVGLAWDNPDIHDQSKWKGRNLFGEILTSVRNDMISMAKYKEEVKAIRDGLEREKRKHSSSSGTSDEDGKPNARKKSTSIRDSVESE